MANKQVLSVVAASILAAAFTFTGCGTDESTPASSSSSVVSSSSSDASSSDAPTSSVSSTSSSEASSSSSSAPTGSTTVKVSDAYVIGATVTIGATNLEIEVGDGVYETAEDNITGAIVVTNGVNDLNGNNVIDTDENNNSEYDVAAVTLKAPAGYANVNPFTTLLEDGLSAENAAKIFPLASAIDPTFDFDVVADSSVANEVYIAVETIKNSVVSSAKGFRAGDLLPGEPASSSVATSSSSAPVEDCTFESGGLLPVDGPVMCDGFTFPSQGRVAEINKMSADELVAEFRRNFAPAGMPVSSSSSSECDESSLLPGQSCDASSSSISSSSSTSSETASSSSESLLPGAP